MRRVEVASKRRLFEGFASVEEVTLRSERRQGGWTEPMRRLVVESGDAVAALVRERTRDELVFVRQLRAPTLRHDEPWLVEIVAGKVDEGETPERTVRREVEEEIGYKPREVTPICATYSSPGILSERVYLYYAEVDESSRTGDGGGVDAGEEVEIVRLPAAEALARAREGRFSDGKTLLALLWLALRRPEGA